MTTTTTPAIERASLAALGLTLPFILLAHAVVLVVWRMLGRNDPPPAEWVSAIALSAGLPLAWATGLAARVARRLPESLDHTARRHRAAAGMIAAFSILAIVQTARVSAFMADWHYGRDAAIPTDESGDHMCLPAYLQAAELARAGDPNLYEASHYDVFASKDLLSLLPASSYAEVGAEDPMHANAVWIANERERDVFGALRCTCGCPRDPIDLLSTCSCSIAEHQRAMVRAQLAAGLTKEQILLAYQQDNGTAALAASQTSDTKVAHMQGKMSDAYEYPPPFLLLPAAALTFSNDFRVIRTAWFILQTFAMVMISLAIVIWIGDREGLVAGLLLPALWASTPFLVNLQFGQAHLLTLALAMAGMAAFESRREALGGALLGASIVMKLVPGLMVVYLLARGRVRPVLSVMVWIAVYSLLCLAEFGPAPYVAFFRYHLPRLASGEAFAFFLGRPALLAANFGVYALPLKLRGLGVPGMTLELSSVVTWIYTLLLLLATIVAARRGSGSRVDSAQRWLAVLNLGALRSPLAPYMYVTSSTIWLLTLLAPTERGTGAVVRLFAAWLYLCVALFVVMHPPFTLWNWTLGQIGVLAINVWAAMRRPSFRGAKMASPAPRGLVGAAPPG